MLEEWIRKARNGEPVWTADVRDELHRAARSHTPGIRMLTMRLTIQEGSVRSFPLPLPDWNTPDERIFVLDYLCASVYNMLSALGGKYPEFDYDGPDEKMTALLREAGERFKPDTPGYGRIIRETDRIGRLAGETVHRYTDIPESGLPAYLQKTAAQALYGVRAGIDVGGTDIKCAVSVDGRLEATLEYDWNPAKFRFASELIRPIEELAGELLKKAGAACFDGIGLSFPDVVIGNRICGGETPKTGGIRAEPAADYEVEFQKIWGINERLQQLCRTGAPVRVANDGFVAAFSSAVELAFSDTPEAVTDGVLSHALGTSLGSGWLDENGELPPIPMEFYDSVVDLGSWKTRDMDTRDLRCTRSENSMMQSTDRYVGQASAFRYAFETDPGLLKGYIEEKNGTLKIKTEPQDLRKPCLEHLMREAEAGTPAAEEIFHRIGVSFGQICRDVRYYLEPKTDTRYIFGRFVKYPHVFELLCDGCAAVSPELSLVAADENIAFSPLMKELSRRKDITVAQFGQAAGAVYLSAT